MKNLQIHLLYVMIFLVTSHLTAQQLDVEGHSRIIGNLELHHMSDSSMNIGTKAGANTSYVGQRTNTLIGFKARQKNFVGSVNTFIGAYARQDNEDGVSNTFAGSGTGRRNVNKMACVFTKRSL